MTDSRSRIQSVQAWRAIAALMVIFAHCHSGAYAGMGKGGDMPFLLGHMDALLTLGFGVDMFLVISGFVLTFVVWNNFSGNPQVGTFFRKRFFRLLPTYWIVLTFMIAFYAVAELMFPSGLTSPDLPVGDYIGSYLFLQTNHAEAAGRMAATVPAFYNFFLPISWTMLFDAYFYLLIGLCLFLPRRWFIPVLVAVFASGVFLLGDSVAENRVFWFLGDSITFDFVWGAAACFAVKKGRLTSNRIAVALILVSAGVIVWSAFSTWPMIRCLWWGLPCAFILYAGIVLERNGKLRIPRVLTSLGDGSYSLYLVHYPVFRAMELILTETNTWHIFGGDTYVCIVFPLCVMAGWLCYRYVENPLDRILSRWRLSTEGPAVAYVPGR